MAEMTVYDELVARGLITQVTDEELIKNLINNGKATFYIGFDPTADSLHVGHFMALCLMKRLQMAGNKPIALVGGGTAMIGDPSGRTDMRQMMTIEQIQHNADCMYEIFPSGNFTYAAPLSGYAAYRIPVWYSAISPPPSQLPKGGFYTLWLYKKKVWS